MSTTRTGLIIVVSAPSGAGKSSLCQRLLNWSSNLTYSVSCTTRTPRKGEQNGVDYVFLSPEEFQERIKANDFLEYAQYNGNYYGTPRAFIEEHLRNGRDVLLDIEVQGAAQVVHRVRNGGFGYPESLVTLFLMPPSMEVLEARLRRRGTDSDETIRKRLELSKQEMMHWREYDYVIVSGDLNDDFEHGKSIIVAEKCRTARQPKDKPWQQKELSF